MEYRVNTELIEELAGQIRQKHQEMEGEINSLQSINSALDGAWDGEAQMQFESSFGDWLLQLRQFTETLNSVNTYLLGYVEARRDLEDQARQAAASQGS